jgi:protein-arginine kinase
MIHSLLKQHSCYLKEHYWNESVWDITQGGYLIGINPKHYTPDAANQIVSNMMEKKSPRKCPPLCMIYTSPRISLDDRNISSKVYTIKYECKNYKDVIRKLKDTFASSTQFLMAKLRFIHPESFANALKIQNHQIMKDTFILPLVLM